MIIMMIKLTKRTQLNLVCAGFHYSYITMRVIIMGSHDGRDGRLAWQR